MSVYQVYSEYSDAEIEWADYLPAHWGRVSLRWISSMYAGGTPSKNVEEYWENGTVPWLNSGAVNQGFIREASTYITKDAFKNSSAKWIPNEALVMALAGQGKTKGMVAQLGMDTTCNQSMAAIVPSKLSDSRYLYWWLTSNYQNIRNMSGGDNRDGLNLELLGNINCPIPSHSEKAKIANFLDHETAKIDTLIEKQQQLIKLLKEKRQAVISRAVTKGLNPDVSMRDSGVEWLGEVPKHWVVAKVKYFASIQGGYAFSSDSFQDNGIQILRIGNVYLNRLALERQPAFVSESFVKTHKSFSIWRGDILMSLTGTLGKTDYGFAVHLDEDGPFMLNQRVAKITPIPTKVIPDYLIYAIRSDSYLKQLYSLPSGTKQANLSNDDVINIPTVVPPSFEEQKLVAQYISDVLVKYDNLIEKSESAIAIMQERRIALISAAVTGKIDVRNWSAPDAHES